ncbi:MAG: TIR domain-containing protein, partial [Acidobacteriaceae bacterium]|nr:TIR domain-containing protein [Acidobacteriaceae bacterium]
MRDSMGEIVARTQVFVSYSHQDEVWLRRLQVHLKVFERASNCVCWDDTKIKPGSKWREEIKAALASTRVAILLVSADYLASEFVAKNELPPLLTAAEREGAVILPVIVRPCQFEDIDSLSRFQSVNPPSKPLSGRRKDSQEKVLLQVAKAVKHALEDARPVSGDDGPPQSLPEKLPLLPGRNPLFTGREDILAEIEHALRSQGRAALTGLGGAGKTETAIEYGHRHAFAYSDVFWVSAATRESLTSGYAAIAHVLAVPENARGDHVEAITAVREYLERKPNWLLILDNTEEIELARSFIPQRNGHVLLTTRVGAVGPIAGRIELEQMTSEEATLLLLRRAKIESPSAQERDAARTIA